MDVSEASNSSGTLANHSPLSDHLASNIYSYEHGVRDPLRFPMQVRMRRPSHRERLLRVIHVPRECLRVPGGERGERGGTFG